MYLLDGEVTGVLGGAWVIGACLRGLMVWLLQVSTRFILGRSGLTFEEGMMVVARRAWDCCWLLFEDGRWCCVAWSDATVCVGRSVWKKKVCCKCVGVGRNGLKGERAGEIQDVFIPVGREFNGIRTGGAKVWERTVEGENSCRGKRPYRSTSIVEQIVERPMKKEQ